MVEAVRRENAKAVVIGLHLKSRAAQALAREVGGQLVQLDSMGDPEDPEKNTYVKLMMDNARRLADALGPADAQAGRRGR